MTCKITSNQNALVTGAGRRIGRAIAMSLAAAEWHVGVHYFHSSDDAETVVDEIQSLGGRAVAIGTDLGAVGASSCGGG